MDRQFYIDIGAGKRGGELGKKLKKRVSNDDESSRFLQEYTKNTTTTKIKRKEWHKP
jgi:hypothetical protein